MSPPLLRQCRSQWSPQEFLSLIIEPVISHLGVSSRAAAQLLLGTALHESAGLQYRRQLGGGPARSFFQMEPATHNDIWANYLVYKPTLGASVEELLAISMGDKIYELEFNDNYAAGMARVHYMRVSEPLPKFNDLDAQAIYWKQYYNTSLGAGTPTKYKNDWHTYVPNSLTYRPDNRTA